jgi:hypothetical protein
MNEDHYYITPDITESLSQGPHVHGWNFVFHTFTEAEKWIGKSNGRHVSVEYLKQLGFRVVATGNPQWPYIVIQLLIHSAPGMAIPDGALTAPSTWPTKSFKRKGL